ncbi:MAG: T9SS type A sorting domain-containing protein [Bacteroidia bacterium]
MKKHLPILTLAALSVTMVNAQHTKYNADGSHYQQCVRFSETESISELAKKYPANMVTHERTMPGDVNAPRRMKKYDPSVPFAEDAARQSAPGSIESSGTIMNFDGETSNVGWPLDPNGAADSTYYVQTVNSQYSVWNKSTGANVAVVDLKTLFGQSTCDDGDPITLYDKFADRWVITEFQENDAGCTGSGNIDTMLMAVSETSSPTGKFYVYRWCPDNTDYADYPKYTIWQDGYYQTCNCQNDKVVVYDRQGMLAGSPTAGFISIPFPNSPFTGSGDDDSFFCPMTLDADGTLPPSNNQNYVFYFTDAQWGAPYTCAIQIDAINVDWSNTSGTISSTATQSLSTDTFDSHFPQDADEFEGIDQPGGSKEYHSVDPLDGFFNYRIPYIRWTSYNTALMANTVNVGTNSTTSSGTAGIRWYELHQDTTTKVWSIYQQGTYAPNDGVNRWDAGLAMDMNGSIGLEYSVSDYTSVYPGIRYTGRRACDTLGEMTLAETTVVSGNADIKTKQGKGNRWGDYTKLCIDPSDGITFWGTSMYSNSSCSTCTSFGNADSRIFSFQIPTCPNSVPQLIPNASEVKAYQSGSMLNVIGSKLPQGNSLYVEVFDNNGKKILSKPVQYFGDRFETSFNVSGLATGIYYVRMGNDDFLRVVKVEINR